MAPAAGPLRISIDSMSVGFRSTARFIWVVPEISPEPSSSSGLKLDVDMLLLSTGTPSMTNSGWASPRMVRVPRMRMNEEAPGSPEDCVTSTLGALAASAWTMFGSLDLRTCSMTRHCARCRASRSVSRCRPR